MTLLVTAIHVLACFFLVAVVLLQHGRGADIGSAFGGGASQTVFGGRGAANFLTRLTTAAAVVFMLTSLTLTYWSAPTSVVDEVADEAPAELPGAVPPESSFPEAAPLEGPAPAQPGEAPAGFEEVPAAPPEPSAAPTEEPAGG
jgi:preprotein translocase subunit SecG